MILIFGGTSDSIEICKKLNENGMSDDYIISVATEYGKSIAENTASNVHMGRMDEDQMCSFIDDNQIDFIIDATHPYAVDVSMNAIKSSNRKNIGYIRYERKSLLENLSYDGCIIVDDIESACDEIVKRDLEDVFIGTGSKNLALYTEKLREKRLFARVLPVSDVILECEELGFSADNIIAMKGPFTKEMNVETFRKYNIGVLITKESGIEGGFMEKIYACEELGIPVVIIKRRKLEYPNISNDIGYIVDQIKRGR